LSFFLDMCSKIITLPTLEYDSHCRTLHVTVRFVEGILLVFPAALLEQKHSVCKVTRSRVW